MKHVVKYEAYLDIYIYIYILLVVSIYVINNLLLRSGHQIKYPSVILTRSCVANSTTFIYK